MWPDAVFAVLAYGALMLLLVGLIWRVNAWLATPSSLRRVLTPAPRGVAGVIWHLFHESVAFMSLWRASPWTWLFGWCFHAALVLVLQQLARDLPVPRLPLGAAELEEGQRRVVPVVAVGVL